jgi:hypothetical protein
LKFTCHILYRIDIAATKTNDRQTALVEINAALEELNQLEGESGGNLVIRTIIIVLSIISLSLVIIMIHYRHVGLVSMAGVTFKFFTEQVAINKGKEYYDDKKLEHYDKDLEDILQYLNEGNWDLAGIGVTQIMDDYNNLIKDGVKNGDICKKEQKQQREQGYWKEYRKEVQERRITRGKQEEKYEEQLGKQPEEQQTSEIRDEIREP